MKSKYFEYIVVYLSVLVVCITLGALIRLFAVSVGADEFTARIIFWAVTGLGVVAYAILALLIEGLFTATVKKFFPQKNFSKTNEKRPIITESLDVIRTEQQQHLESKKQEKLETAIRYTRREFAPYVSDSDMELLCQHIRQYSEQLPFSDIQTIKVKTLSTLDIYHFGWNIWKHFSNTKQESVAQFLKLVFADTLSDVEPDTIKSHLKDDPKKGIILIQEKLFD